MNRTKPIVTGMVELSNISSDYAKVIEQDLRVTNPLYVSHVRFGNRYAAAPPKHINVYEKSPTCYRVPRGWFFSTHPAPATLKTHQPAAEFPEPLLEPLSHQREALEAVIEYVNACDESGHPADCYVVMPPSSGKTIFGMLLANCLGLKTLVVVPTKEIESGWCRDLHKVYGINKDDIGRIRGKTIDIRPFTIGSIQTLMDLDPALWADKFGLLLLDECVVGSTDVGGRPIREVVPGDYVRAYDETSEKVVSGKVARVGSRAVTALVEIVTKNGSIACSENHPVYTSEGWMTAIDILGVSLGFNHDKEKHSIDPHTINLQGVRERVRGMGLQGPVKPQKEGLLILWESLLECPGRGAPVEEKQDYSESTDARGRKPNEVGGMPNEGFKDTSGYGSRANCEGRERHRADDPSTNDVRRSLVQRGRGGVCSYYGVRENESGCSVPLQTGHSDTVYEGLRGDRRTEPQYPVQEGAGRKEGRVLEWVRVDSIALLEQGRDRRFEEVCPDGRVYNLEVEGYHTYLANGAVTHNCHKIPGVRFSEVVRKSAAHIRVGITATDYRKDGQFAIVKMHLSHCAYRNEAYLNSVPLHYMPVKTSFGLSGSMSLKRVDSFTFNDLLASLESNPHRNRAITDLIRKILKEYPGDILVVSPRVNHIKTLADALELAGVKAAVITGGSSGRENLFDKVLKGEYRVTIATTKIMSEGASNPRWHHIVNTMPFSDPKTAVQLGGRPIRKSEGKTVGYFWDFVDSNPMAKHMALARWKALGKNMKAVTAYVADATGPTTKFIASATKETQNNKSA